MRKLLFLVSIILILENVYGQMVPVKEFLNSLVSSSKKIEHYLNKNSFIPAGRWLQRDTIVNAYRQKLKKKKDSTQQTIRIIETYQRGNNYSFSYQTTSEKELDAGKKILQEEGFFCGNTESSKDCLYQKRNLLVYVSCITGEENDTLYSFLFHIEKLPAIADLQSAEDLLQFTSHEYLCSVFGEKNVLRDVYFFSEKEISRCSVLFPRTNRQAVFIWADEINYCRLSSVLIGGDLPVGSLKNTRERIWENKWITKEGIYAGMSLNNLVHLNGNDFNFYGKKSQFPYMVVPENNGIINFKKSQVILGCLNPNGSKILNNTLISTSDLPDDNSGIYVLMFMILPSEHKTLPHQVNN
jgi:hypothetical protein